jgi:hypothetical protein
MILPWDNLLHLAHMVFPQGNVSNGIRGIIRTKAEWLVCNKNFNGQKEFGGVPSSLKELHKYMNED